MEYISSVPLIPSARGEIECGVFRLVVPEIYPKPGVSAGRRFHGFAREAIAVWHRSPAMVAAWGMIRLVTCNS